MSRKETLGFDRKLDLAWLDAAAAAASRGDELAKAREQLFAVLDGVVAGDGPHSGRGKTITVLSRIWLAPASTDLGKRALRALDDAASPGERLAIHWAMCAATHPFFVDVVAAVGRLVKMQGDVSQAQVTRRVAETWGDRSTLHRAVQRVCRSLIAWGVLQETPTRGMYRIPAQRLVSGPAARLLVEAILTGGRSQAAPLADVLRHPALFPFDVRLTSGELRTAPEFDVDRQGLDVDVVRVAL
jgi:hypothetical protein